jgi:hypothetical protein
MTNRPHSSVSFMRQMKRQRMLRKMANMRAAKERIRLERGSSGLLEREPKMARTTCLSFAVRDDITGHVEWLPLKSVRDTMKRIAVLLREYKPGYPT